MEGINSVGITGVGRHLPSLLVTNEDLAKNIEVTAEWIEKRTGIRSRHYAHKDDSASGFAVEAARRALKNAELNPDSLDLIIGCTSSRDYIFPPLAAKVQYILGANNAGAFDLTAGAAGFQMGLTLAASHLSCKSSPAHVLLIGSALLSRYLNWADYKSSILFGDGAGAVILSRVPEKYGILSSEMFCDGSVYETFRLRGGGSSFPLSESAGKKETHFIEMDGLKVGRHFLKHQPEVIERSLKKIGLSISDVDLFIFHQANLRLLHALMDSMKIPRIKTYTNVERVGNTADASLAIALSEAIDEGCIKRDSVVVIAGAGPGGIYGSSVLRWF